jgi:phosphotransferase system HPr-like phosphotransfer protein
MLLNLNEVSKINKFVNEASTFQSDIDIRHDHYICDAKSILALYSFDLSKPVEVTINAVTPEEEKRFEEVFSKYKVEV